MSVTSPYSPPEGTAPCRPAADAAPASRCRRGWFALLFAFFGPIAFALDPLEKPANYIATRWDTEDGLPHNSVKQIFQSRDGYIWVGTMQGLARFDGLTFTVFTQHNTPSFPNNQITSFAETADGSLWIGTSLGLARYKNGRFTSFGKADGLKSATVNALCVALDGSLWIGGREGVTRWVGEKFINDIDLSGYDMIALRAITRDRHDAMWIAAGSDALRYVDGRFTHFGRAEGLPAKPLQMLRETADGRMLAATQGGVFRLEGERFVGFEQNQSLSSQRVGAAVPDRVGNLWIGSVNGLDRAVNGAVTPYTDRAGNKLGVVDAVLEDREGCLWLGTSTGLYRLTDRRGYSLSAEDGLTGTLATSVQQTRDGALWVATWAGGVHRFQNGTMKHFSLGAPLSHETVTTIYEAPDGTMWLGTRGSSLDRLEDGRATTFVYQPGVATSRPVTALHAEAGGELLIGISKRGLLELRDGKITPVPEAADLAAATVWSIVRWRDGRLVIGTSVGLYERGSDRRWQKLALRGLPQSIVARAFLEQDDGTLWIATEGHGLVRWAKGAMRAYDSRVGMVDDTLFSIVSDERGSLWVSSARGLARIQLSDLAEIDRGGAPRLNLLTFGRGDGLLNGSTSGTGSPAAARLTDGRIVTATDIGVAVITPASLQINRQPPTVVIEQVMVDDEPLTPGASITIPPGLNRLEIRYTALSLAVPQRLRFRYQLEGSDPRWVEAVHERSARYTHLTPGTYTFRVQACNSDGVWSETSAALAITLQPHFYETTWFKFAGAVLCLLGLAGLIGWRLRILRQRQFALARANAELDQRVRERTRQLSLSNEELQHRESLFRLIFEHAPLGISWHRTDLGPQYHCNAAFRQILDLPAETLPDNTLLRSLTHPADAGRHAELEADIQLGRADRYAIEQRFVRKDGREVWGALAAAVVRDPRGKIIQVIGLLEDITARKAAERELTNTHQRLMDASRLAGMAEVATGVLHNVGNVLNSVNVSATVLADRVRASKIGGLAKLGELLRTHESDLGTFFTQDPRGRVVPGFIATLNTHLTAEQGEMLAELRSLQKNIEHIKDIVAMQQSHAKISGLTEVVAASELVEDAVRMSAPALVRHGVTVIREFQAQVSVNVEKHKVLQILVNLITNAKHACADAAGPDKRMTLRISAARGRVKIAISDNGVGIPAENLTRIFHHGFTTRKNGHGFGLHNGALAAKELGGALTVDSEGPGRGATFTLELPEQVEAQAA